MSGRIYLSYQGAFNSSSFDAIFALLRVFASHINIFKRFHVLAMNLSSGFASFGESWSARKSYLNHQLYSFVVV